MVLPKNRTVGLAFMQNMWFKDPAKVRKILARHDEAFRLRFIKYTLFGGCVSGRRIREAFKGLVDLIVWEESSREIGGNAASTFKPDLQHMQAAIELHQPAVVLTFGVVARDAVKKVWRGKLIDAPHPASRQMDLDEKLRESARAFYEIATGKPFDLQARFYILSESDFRK